MKLVLRHSYATGNFAIWRLADFPAHDLIMKIRHRMFDHFKQLLSISHAHSVKYLVVDGYAEQFSRDAGASKLR
jgi:hypothetical protein